MGCFVCYQLWIRWIGRVCGGKFWSCFKKPNWNWVPLLELGDTRTSLRRADFGTGWEPTLQFWSGSKLVWELEPNWNFERNLIRVPSGKGFNKIWTFGHEGKQTWISRKEMTTFHHWICPRLCSSLFFFLPYLEWDFFSHFCEASDLTTIQKTTSQIWLSKKINFFETCSLV